MTKIRREERYHLLHADTWLKRVAQGPVEGRKRLADSIGVAFGESLGLFEPFEGEQDALSAHWMPVSSSELRQRFVGQVAEKLDALGLPTHMTSHAEEGAEFVASSSGDLIASDNGERSAPSADDGFGGRRGRRTPDFDALWEDMTSMYRTSPGARW